MSELFLSVFNRSVSAIWLVAAVAVARLVLKKAPKWCHVALWAVVALRLVLPALPESGVSLIPSSQILPQEVLLSPTPTVDTGIESVNEIINPVLSQSMAPAPGDSVNPLQVYTAIAGQVWLLGMVGMGLYAILSVALLRRRLRGAEEEEAGVWRSGAVESPFILGLLRPRVYLPLEMEERARGYVLEHERAHLARRDHWWKPLGFVLLSIHWFNPVIWLGYILLCRDIELACDERVIHTWPEAQRADYSQTLLSLSVRSTRIAACPLAFGEVGVGARIRRVLNYRKPALWVTLAAVVLCVAVAVCFLTDPEDPIVPGGQTYIPLEELPEDYSLEQAKLDGCVVMEDGDISFGWDIWQSFYEATGRGTAGTVRYVSYFTLGDPSRYGKEYYESIKDEYPKMFVHDLTFDGERYHVRWFEDTGEIRRSYTYLHCFRGKAESPYATYDSYTRFVLCDRNDVTWEELFGGMVSSQLGAYIDHMTVITDLVREGEQGGDRLAVGTYVPVRCVYMSPLSSFSGTRLAETYRYRVLEDRFVTEYLPDSSSSETEVAWQWSHTTLSSKEFREYPFTIYEECQYQQVGHDRQLLKRGDGLYLIHTGDPSSKYTAVWSVYALLPETGHTARVVNLLDSICLSPAYASAPGAYVEAHREEYAELVGMGADALEVCFTLFLQGAETGLRGHIMALACQEILSAMGEPVAQEMYMTGQAWFDGYLQRCDSLLLQERPDQIRDTYPGMYLLLQLQGRM